MSADVIFQNDDCTIRNQTNIEKLDTLNLGGAPENYVSDVTFKCSPEQKKTLTQLAKMQGIGRSTLIRKSVLDYLKRMDQAAEMGMSLEDFYSEAADILTTYWKHRETTRRKLADDLADRMFLKTLKSVLG